MVIGGGLGSVVGRSMDGETNRVNSAHTLKTMCTAVPSQRRNPDTGNLSE